jgi:hypothetical protein
MADYKNGDVVTVVKGDESKEVTYKAYNVVYKDQGYKLDGEATETNENEDSGELTSVEGLTAEQIDNDYTAPQIKKYLDQEGIEYKSNDSKPVLIEKALGGANDGE